MPPTPRHAHNLAYTNRFHASPDWGPLERVAELCQSPPPELPNLDPDDFMYMGRTEHPSLPAIHFYKHILTRRYLNLDAAGHAYALASLPAGVEYDTRTVEAGRGRWRWQPVRYLPSAIARVHDLWPEQGTTLRPPLSL